MKATESENNIQLSEPVCDFRYLIDIVNGKTYLISGIMDVFLKQVPEDIQCINEAITNTDYKTIKSYTHTMKSSVSIMGISILMPVLMEMENLGIAETDIEKIKQLNLKLKVICVQAIDEIKKEKLNYNHAILKKTINKNSKS
ncbi:MAG: hypothetical protein A2X08_10275 [Bacteroidetes bacterium GWA2_32_17]|nr:MAG: hypothetical protein A2X08_10275 [Bacteroidetes bacterium GWA2_32_17]